MCLLCLCQDWVQLVSVRGVGISPRQDRTRDHGSGKRAVMREACMRELQAAAKSVHLIVAVVARAIEAGSEQQPSAQLVGVCCNALDPLLGASMLVSGRSNKHAFLQPAPCA
jgi:hypothetical protein